VEVSGEFYALAASLPEVNKLGTDRIGGWVGPEPVLGLWRKEKLLVPYWDSNPAPPYP